MGHCPAKHACAGLTNCTFTLIDGHRERTVAGLKAAKGRGVKLGRPSALTEKQILMARSLKAAGDLSSADIAKQLGVGRSTLYRALGSEF
ncbi:helix-turn-helix domain-containing protein [Maricaulis sp.]|uniref:helix-turn-helix domain-containing protein n=1 Tax=Maricaulis sp. TaxID=1486257 RepID=UPI0025C2DDE7|nr:helix-turn-helix domain-containing protein [Maricaulis sp.]